jgi:hypothetical protein
LRNADEDYSRIPPEIDEKGEFHRLVGHDNQVRWLEKKIHEQSMLVTDLIHCGTSELTIESERRKLRILELLRFKHFRKTMLEKLRPKVIRGSDGKSVPLSRMTSGSDLNTPNNLALPPNGQLTSMDTTTSETSKTDASVTASMILENGEMEENIKNSTSTPNVDMNIDAQVVVTSCRNTGRFSCTLTPDNGYYEPIPIQQPALTRLLSAPRLATYEIRRSIR